MTNRLDTTSSDGLKDPSTMQSGVLPPLPCERMLIETMPQLKYSRAIVISPGRAQTAWRLAELDSSSTVQAWYLDLYDANQASIAAEKAVARVEVVCAADLPEEPYHLIAMPVLVSGEAELTRELMQQAHQRLIDGGTLMVSVDNPRDQWLRLQMEAIFDKVTCADAVGGRVYWARKNKPLRKVKNFGCDFTFRDSDHLIHAHSRPGVFSHRRLDPGARQLLLAAEIEPSQRVLDLGCGSGVIALAAALRGEDIEVVAVDSNSRAVECTQLGARLNEISNVQAVANFDGELDCSNTFDLVLANPPYFANFRIAEHFLSTASKYLRPGGALLVVTKQPTWYEQRLINDFEDITIFPSGKYNLACGRKK